jgi:dihydroorotase
MAKVLILGKESFILRKGKVFVCPPKSGVYTDLLVEAGKIKKISDKIKNTSNLLEIDVEGCYIFPGFIDMHVHSRQPGREDEETVESLLRAAAKGGFVGVLTMPNTTPPINDASRVHFLKNLAEKVELAPHIFISATLTKESESGGQLINQLVDIGELKEAGCLALSDDGSPIQDSSLLALALQYASMFSLLVITHCEDTYLSREGQINEGYIACLMGLRGIPNQAESIMVKRNINLLELAPSRLHITHVSTKEAIEEIERAKYRGLNITGDVTPHHIILDESYFLQNNKLNYDTNLKMKPPLRKKEDKEALLEGLKKGVIDVIASDHAPHTAAEKELEFENAPFGVIGVETAVASTYDALVKEKILSLEEWAAKFSSGPAKILNLADNFGKLEEGKVANITVINPNSSWRVVESELLSKSKNSWCLNWEFSCKVILTIANGKIIFHSEEIKVL